MTEAASETGNINIGIGIVKGRVVMDLHERTNQIHFDPENARLVAEELARRAYEARFGPRPTGSGSMVAEAMRKKLVTRVSLMLRSGAEQRWSNGKMATAIVDACLREAT